MTVGAESAVPTAAGDDTGDAATTPVLSVADLSVELLGDRGWLPIVDRVSFSVSAGETVGLVGESGSGKTVSCLAINRLLPARTARITSGSIRLDGVELVGRSARAMEDVRGREIAMIFQEPMTSLNPAFTIGEQISEVVRRHRGASRRVARDRAVEMLDAVGIPDARSRLGTYPHELSGGMRQRAMIAMALSCEPRLLIADEPTTALDVTVQAQVLDVLRGVSRDLGTAVVFVTHDLGVVADLCDRVVVMYAGQVVETSGVDGVFDDPRHPYTRALLRAMPQIGAREGTLPVIPGGTPRAGMMPAGCRFHPRCEFADERCRSSAVELVPISAARSTRCLRHDELFGGERP